MNNLKESIEKRLGKVEEILNEDGGEIDKCGGP